jgi:hypothetical protein
MLKNNQNSKRKRNTKEMKFLSDCLFPFHFVRTHGTSYITLFKEKAKFSQSGERKHFLIPGGWGSYEISLRTNRMGPEKACLSYTVMLYVSSTDESAL